MADDFWKAGFDLAAELGIFCISSNRIIKFSEEEIKEYLRKAPSEIVVGEGKDKRVILPRSCEDQSSPICFGGPLGTSASEDLFVPIVQSCAQYRVIDGIASAWPISYRGKKFRTKTPSEIFGTYWHVQLTQEAVNRAGRIDMPRLVGGISLYGGLGVSLGIKKVGSDIACVSAISEFKTEYDSLGKAILFKEGGYPIQAFHHSIIGGYVGGPEGAAIARVAATILMFLLYKTDITGCTVYDFRYAGNCGRDTIWANSISTQAITRNSHLLCGDLVDPSAGPGTSMILYEIAVNSLNCVADGACWVNGVRSASGKYINHNTGLESKFAAEVIKSLPGMKRSDANDIALALISKYEKDLENPPIGKSFSELYNVTTLKPSQRWIEIYNNVLKELKDLGCEIIVTPF